MWFQLRCHYAFEILALYSKRLSKLSIKIVVLRSCYILYLFCYVNVLEISTYVPCVCHEFHSLSICQSLMSIVFLFLTLHMMDEHITYSLCQYTCRFVLLEQLVRRFSSSSQGQSDITLTSQLHLGTVNTTQNCLS